jgi:hypothetical protein
MIQRKIIVFGALGLLSIYGYSQVPTARDAQLTRKLSAIPRSDSALSQFAAILSAVGAPGGIAYIHAGCSGETKRDLPALEELTAAQALDALAAVEGPYRWDRVDGAIVMLPSEGAPALLKTPIDAVHLSDVSNLNISLQELLDTQEVVAATKRLGLTFQGFRGGFAKLNRSPSKPSPKPLDLRGVTLLQGLNLVAREHGVAVWAYDQYECPGRSFQLTFIGQ